jgi:hypothetical protein
MIPIFLSECNCNEESLPFAANIIILFIAAMFFLYMQYKHNKEIK